MGVTLKGQFTVLSVAGAVLHESGPNKTEPATFLSASLANPSGGVVGGLVAGSLIASQRVTVRSRPFYAFTLSLPHHISRLCMFMYDVCQHPSPCPIPSLPPGLFSDPLAAHIQQTPLMMALILLPLAPIPGSAPCVQLVLGHWDVSSTAAPSVEGEVPPGFAAGAGPSSSPAPA